MNGIFYYTPSSPRRYQRNAMAIFSNWCNGRALKNSNTFPHLWAFEVTLEQLRRLSNTWPVVFLEGTKGASNYYRGVCVRRCRRASRPWVAPQQRKVRLVHCCCTVVFIGLPLRWDRFTVSGAGRARSSFASIVSLHLPLFYLPCSTTRHAAVINYTRRSAGSYPDKPISPCSSFQRVEEPSSCWYLLWARSWTFIRWPYLHFPYPSTICFNVPVATDRLLPALQLLDLH